MTQEELNKKITLVCQDAWKQEGNTTINSMVAWILKAVLYDVVEELNNEISVLKELINGKDGGLQKPERHSKAGKVNGSTDARI